MNKTKYEGNWNEHLISVGEEKMLEFAAKVGLPDDVLEFRHGKNNTAQWTARIEFEEYEQPNAEGNHSICAKLYRRSNDGKKTDHVLTVFYDYEEAEEAQQ